jgi:hypothetical protein
MISYLLVTEAVFIFLKTSTVFQDNVTGPGASCARGAAALHFKSRHICHKLRLRDSLRLAMVFRHLVRLPPRDWTRGGPAPQWRQQRQSRWVRGNNSFNRHTSRYTYVFTAGPCVACVTHPETPACYIITAVKLGEGSGEWRIEAWRQGACWRCGWVIKAVVRKTWIRLH